MKNRFNDNIMHQILNESHTGLWTIEAEDGKKPRLYGNDTMMQLLGITSDQFSPEDCYQHWYQRIDPEALSTVNMGIRNMLTQQIGEVQYIWHHPEWGEIFIRCGGIKELSFQHGYRINGYHQNITRLIQLQAEKNQLEKLNQALMESLHNLFFAVYRIDLREQRFVPLRIPEYLQKEFQEGMSQEDFFHRLAKHTIHPQDYKRFVSDLSFDHIQAMISSGSDRFSAEYRHIYQKGYHWSACSIYHGLDRHTDYAILAFQDIQERKFQEQQNQIALEEAYRSAQSANHAKSDFLSRMSHDLRTPLNAVIGASALAQGHIQEPWYLADSLCKIENAGKQLLDLVNKILDMSKIDQGKFALDSHCFSIKELLQDTLTIVLESAQAKNLSLTMDDSQIYHSYVIGDSLRLQQVMINIVSNAINYTPDGGQITITAKEVSSPALQMGVYQFTFTDTGIGMSKEFLSQMFQPFTRADDSRVSKISGSGLGMTITQNIIHMMGGNITVESSPGKGSCFIVQLSLPLQDNASSLEHLTDYAEELDGPRYLSQLQMDGFHFLLVEDNELNREIALEILSMTNAAVDYAEDGLAAIEVFEQSSPFYYNAIFMDIQMPRMNGLESAKKIRALNRPDAAQIPIIAMTANAFLDDVEQVKQAGMNLHISKPIDIVRLADAIKDLVTDTNKPASC